MNVSGALRAASTQAELGLLTLINSHDSLRTPVEQVRPSGTPTIFSGEVAVATDIKRFGEIYASDETPGLGHLTPLKP